MLGARPTIAAMQVAWKEAKRRARLGVWDQYDSLGQIGQGTYGVVYKIVSKNRCASYPMGPAQCGRPTNDRSREARCSFWLRRTVRTRKSMP